MTPCQIALRRFALRPSKFSPFPTLLYAKQPAMRASYWTLAGLATKLRLFAPSRPRSEPRTFPSQGFGTVDKDQPIEEEGMPGYSLEYFYRVRLGEIFHERYQTVAKLGYGSCSTIWLARDLEDHKYVALKVYIHNSVRHHICLGSFEVIGPHGKHIALVLQVSQMSLRDWDMVFMQSKGFDEDFVKAAIKELLEAVDFLHTEVQAVHTDIHPGNLLLGTNDDSMSKALEDEENSNTGLRKEVEDRTLYLSRLLKPKVGPLLLSDFGEARLGPGPHAGDIMPVMYRAPETLLWIQWSYPVDIWSVGLTAWTLLEGRHLFSALREDGTFSDGAHLSELIAALGPPPSELLDRNRERALEYWDENYKWVESVPIRPQTPWMQLKASFKTAPCSFSSCEEPSLGNLANDPLPKNF